MDFKRFAQDAEIPRIPYNKVMQKIQDGEWEAEQDVTPRKHVQMRETKPGGKRFMVWVE